ncbi:MAG: GH39 family glycosyl hydrolase, partial [Steroidobacteraceae bacterium]
MSRGAASGYDLALAIALVFALDSLADAGPKREPESRSTTAAVAAQPSLGQPGMRKITVDAARTVGTLRSLQGVNGAPGPGGHKPENFTFGGWNMRDDIDASAGYRLARIDLVRTHDGYGPGDIDAKFESAAAPGGGLISARRDIFSIFPDLGADPENPASYRFGPTDKLIASIEKIGAQVLFRLGRSEGADPTPPPDFDRYAAVAKHIVLHYNRGWANGYHYGIRYWEVWNEPDLGKLFWAGTEQQYFELYGKLARAVKAADSHALVGGPAIAKPNDHTPYRDELMRQAHSAHVPFDFYSWHWYATDSSDPRDFNRIAHDLRTRLDRYGLTKTASFLTEWNYGLSDPPPSPLVRASFITSALIYMQDAPIDAATLYRADNVFGPDGATPDQTGQALIALGQMKSTPVRLAVVGADADGFAVEAGRSRDGRLLRVLISNYQIPAQLLGRRAGDDILHVPPVFDVRLLSRRDIVYRDNVGLDLTVEHLPPGRAHVLERCRITDRDDFKLMSTVIAPGKAVHLSEELPPPGV